MFICFAWLKRLDNQKGTEQMNTGRRVEMNINYSILSVQNIIESYLDES